MIYTTCEQCQTHCTIKVVLTDPAKTGGKAYVRKIAGNPYSPLNTVPYDQIPYETSPFDAARGHGNLAVDGRLFAGGRTCLKGQAGIQTAYDAYRIAQAPEAGGPPGLGRVADDLVGAGDRGDRRRSSGPTSPSSTRSR